MLFRKARVHEQTDSYRRGLVLGLTMAEIAILIIFILLLALAALLARERTKRETAERDLAAARAQAESLKDQVSVANEILGGQDIEVFIRELVEARSEAAKAAALAEDVAQKDRKIREWRRELAELRSQADSNSELLARTLKAEEEVRQWREATSDGAETNTPGSVSEALDQLKVLEPLIEESMGGDIAAVAEKISEIQSENTRLTGQVANMRRLLKGAGKGTEKPACWANPEGKPEYIYDVALTSRGLIVREVDLPHRQEEKSRLPLDQVPLLSEISSTRFIAATRPLFEWSEAKDCRFFVRVYDETGATEKEVYRSHLRAVEGNFYKYEVLDRAFE